MKLIARILVCIIIYFSTLLENPCYANGNGNEIVVVVHKNNPTLKLTRSQVIDLFMGKYVAFPNGQKALTVEIDGNIKIKQDFYLTLVGQSLARVNSYWSRIKFTGRSKPSLKKNTPLEVIEYIVNHENAIGYISKEELNSQLKVVYQFDE